MRGLIFTFASITVTTIVLEGCSYLILYLSSGGPLDGVPLDDFFGDFLSSSDEDFLEDCDGLGDLGS